MKLYKFLLITDYVIEAVMLETYAIKADINNHHKNSIFTLKPEYMHDELRFMRFQYPNGGSYRWAYVIIDSNSVAKISQHKWGTTKDKIGNNHQSKADKLYDNPYRVVDEDRTKLMVAALNEYGQDYDADGIKQYRYIKMGGWLSNSQPKMGALHKYIITNYGQKEVDTNLRVHHKGHTFDNRRAFLKEVSIGKHRIIHNRWERMDNSKGDIRSNIEPKSIFNRAERITLGDCYCRDFECNGCKKDCKLCNGVLLIDTVDALKKLLSHISDGEYWKLSLNGVYSMIN